MSTLTPARQRLLAVLVPALLVALAWWFAIWAPRGREHAETLDHTEQTEARAIQLTGRLHTAKTFRNGGRRSDDALKRARQALPDTADVGGFLRRNDMLAAATGVTVESVNPTEADPTKRDPSTPPGTQATSVALTVGGTSSAAVDYLSGLAALPRAVVIDRITMTSSGDAIRMDLVARIFQTAPAGGFSTTRGT